MIWCINDDVAMNYVIINVTCNFYATICMYGIFSRRITFRFENPFSDEARNVSSVVLHRYPSGPSRGVHQEIFPTARGKLSPSYSRAHISAHSSFEIALTSDLRTIYRRAKPRLLPSPREPWVTYLHVSAVYIASVELLGRPFSPNSRSFVHSFVRSSTSEWIGNTNRSRPFLLGFDASVHR